MRYRIRRALSLAALATACAAGTALIPFPGDASSFAGEILTADGTPTDGLRLRLRIDGWAGSATVDAGGRFRVALPGRFPADSVDVRIEAGGADGPGFHAATRRMHRRDLAADQRVVLVPRRWTVAAGRHAGAEVEIRLDDAYRPTCTGCAAFFRRVSGLGAGVASAGVPAWPEEVFPLRIAFDRGWSEAPLTPADSVAFWRIAAEVDEAFGRPLFRPAPFAEVAPVDDRPGDVILVWVVPSIRSLGRGAVGFLNENIIHGALWLRSARTIHEPHGRSLVAHELLHTLGFGHTCAWRSVLADVTRCPGQRSDLPTATDVAYVELAWAVTALSRGTRHGWGLEAAHTAGPADPPVAAAGEPGGR